MSKEFGWDSNFQAAYSQLHKEQQNYIYQLAKQ